MNSGTLHQRSNHESIYGNLCGAIGKTAHSPRVSIPMPRENEPLYRAVQYQGDFDRDDP